jgi:hypothetical protein
VSYLFEKVEYTEGERKDSIYDGGKHNFDKCVSTKYEDLGILQLTFV